MQESEAPSSIYPAEPSDSGEIAPGAQMFLISVSEADVLNALEFAWEISEMLPEGMSLDVLGKLTIGWMQLQANLRNSA